MVRSHGVIRTTVGTALIAETQTGSQSFDRTQEKIGRGIDDRRRQAAERAQDNWIDKGAACER